MGLTSLICLHVLYVNKLNICTPCPTGKYLLELGQSLEYLLHVAMQKAGIEALKYTVLSGVMSAVAWPVGIMALSHAIDNPWRDRERGYEVIST